MTHQIKTIKLFELNLFLRKMHFSNESRKRKTNCSWPLTLIMQKHDHFRLLRHHYSEIPVIPLSNDIWYRCVAHEFITFYFLIFYLWSKYIYIFCTINMLPPQIPCADWPYIPLGQLHSARSRDPGIYVLGCLIWKHHCCIVNINMQK